MRASWNDASLYGKKAKRYFLLLDKMIIKLLKKESPTLEDIEQIVKLTGRQNTITHTISKLVENMDTNARMIKLEKLFDNVPAEVIGKYMNVPANDSMFGK